ncbi:hypothetical protein B0H14DRAFT_3475801 [Mycena olivaceomarginata]|nr:hypothetical protein B0H14DRAFT_3475801 [Mycena olivaceomarginata]
MPFSAAADLSRHIRFAVGLENMKCALYRCVDRIPNNAKATYPGACAESKNSCTPIRVVPAFHLHRHPICRTLPPSSVVQLRDTLPHPPPLKSVLRPPNLAPSAWQLYTDWIQRQQANSTHKLNVAQAAKEAGQEYASLSKEEKEPYKHRSQAAKDVRERQLASYMRTLTPDDIKREKAFRAAQRKAGKLCKSNIKDPNALKKPLSAYFMFLQRICGDKHLVEEVFGEETETTRQSVLAAAQWRAMSDKECKSRRKREYGAAHRVYEDGASPSMSASTPHVTVGMGGPFNFSILPGVGVGFPAIKIELSESEGEGDGKFLPPSAARS